MHSECAFVRGLAGRHSFHSNSFPRFRESLRGWQPATSVIITLFPASQSNGSAKTPGRRSSVALWWSVAAGFATGRRRAGAEALQRLVVVANQVAVLSLSQHFLHQATHGFVCKAIHYAMSGMKCTYSTRLRTNYGTQLLDDQIVDTRNRFPSVVKIARLSRSVYHFKKKIRLLLDPGWSISLVFFFFAVFLHMHLYPTICDVYLCSFNWISVHSRCSVMCIVSITWILAWSIYLLICQCLLILLLTWNISMKLFNYFCYKSLHEICMRLSWFFYGDVLELSCSLMFFLLTSLLSRFSQTGMEA